MNTSLETGLDVGARERAFPRTPTDLDAGFLEPILRRHGFLGQGHITAISHEFIGAGLVGDSVRFSLYYDNEERGPRTIAAKFAAADPTSRATAKALGLYEKEVNFYTQIAARVKVRAPKAYFAEYDADSGAFLLLMEDMGPACGGDQLSGCTLEQAKAALREAAALHGPSWCDASLRALPMFERGKVDEQVLAAFPAVMAAFHERYDGVLEAEYMEVCDGFAAKFAEFYQHDAGVFSVIHGDFRLDNMLFDIMGGAEPCGILDWQTCALGSPMKDLGYFLGAGLPIAFRRAHQDELLDTYLAELRRHGVEGYDKNAALHDLRRAQFHGVMMAVFSPASVERTERGDAMFLSMARGACQLAIDCDALNIL